jgi:hypothetical protein
MSDNAAMSGDTEKPDRPSPDGAAAPPHDDANDSPPAAQAWWSRIQSTAQKVASGVKDAGLKAAQVTAEMARETAQVARDGANESAAMAKHTMSNFGDVRDQTGSAFAKIGRSVTETTVGIAQSASKTIADASAEAVKALVANMNEALPFIERAGYRVSEIELGLTVPPKIVMHLSLDGEISDAMREALLKDCEGKWFTRQLIERLHNVRQIQRATEFVGMAFDEIEIEIALVPSVLLHYRKVHRNVKLAANTPLADAVEAREALEAPVKPAEP